MTQKSRLALALSASLFACSSSPDEQTPDQNSWIEQASADQKINLDTQYQRVTADHLKRCRDLFFVYFGEDTWPELDMPPDEIEELRACAPVLFCDDDPEVRGKIDELLQMAGLTRAQAKTKIGKINTSQMNCEDIPNT